MRWEREEEYKRKKNVKGKGMEEMKDKIGSLKMEETKKEDEEEKK